MQTLRTLALPAVVALTLIDATAGPALAQEVPDTGGQVFGLVGGGDVRLWKGFGVGADVRYLRLLDDAEGFDFAFVTSRISYRF